MIEDTLLALAEPTRLRIVEFLAPQARSVSEICQFLTIDQPLVSKHLGTLRRRGIVSVEPVQRNRMYSLRPGPMKELSDWVDRFRAVWDARYRAVDEILDELKKLEKEENHGWDQGGVMERPDSDDHQDL